MRGGKKKLITDIDELKEFIKTNKKEEDYFDLMIGKVISNKFDSEEE